LQKCLINKGANHYNYSEEKDIIIKTFVSIMSKLKYKITKLPYEPPTKEDKRRAYGDYLYNWLFTTGAPRDYRVWREVGIGHWVARDLLPTYEDDEEIE